MTTSLDVEHTIVPEPEDPVWHSPEYQSGLLLIQHDLERLDPGTRTQALLRESAESSALLQGLFTVAVDKVLPLAGTAVASWLAERHGRKVFLRAGDIEAEAGSVQEIDQLLAQAQEIRATEDRRRLL